MADSLSLAAGRSREVWVDWMRVVACFLVMVVHSTEPFYLGGEGSLILTRADAFWASLFDTFARACVPLFVVASSYLQFPIHYSTGEFFRRRAVRILIPFLFWTVVYALVWGEPVANFKDLLLNFNYAAGHLWFVYMLIGLYLLMPLLSPWAEKVSRRELLFFLALCFATYFIPFIREKAAGDGAVFIYGPGGIPMPADYPLWGEASWNAYGLFYYFSGFIGYLLLGLYLRRFVGQMSTGRTLAIALPCWIGGFAVCFFGFLRRVFATAGGCGGFLGSDGSVFPIGGDISVAAGWETPWLFCTVGTLLMTIGWILLMRLWRAEGGFYRKVVLPVSKAGYGMYLCHMLALGSFAALFRSRLGVGTDGVLGVMTTPVEIILTAVCSYIVVALFSVLVQRIPKIGKFIIG
ncbi:MAG: acyltransferase family protein [Bacteroidales bacterium]|nr:acyltransferase family protein [Candidatus Cryptobacteroides aphodequi]